MKRSNQYSEALTKPFYLDMKIYNETEEILKLNAETMPCPMQFYRCSTPISLSKVRGKTKAFDLWRAELGSRFPHSQCSCDYVSHLQ